MSLYVTCERCKRKVLNTDAVMLEFDQRTQKYTDQPVPGECSQGGFWLGKDCAAKELSGKIRKAKHKAPNLLAQRDALRKACEEAVKELDGDPHRAALQERLFNVLAFPAATA